MGNIQKFVRYLLTIVNNFVNFNKYAQRNNLEIQEHNKGRLDIFRLSITFIFVCAIVFGLSSEAKASKDKSTQTIEYGDNITGSISVVDEVDTIYFAGESGEVVSIFASSPDGISPGIQLYDPDGQLIHSFIPNSGIGSVREKLISSGIFTILFYDHQMNATGTYNLSLVCVSPHESGQVIGYGYSDTARTEFSSQQDIYRFTAESGDVVSIHGSRIEGEITPAIHLYGPDGLMINSDANNSSQAFCTAPF